MYAFAKGNGPNLHVYSNISQPGQHGITEMGNGENLNSSKALTNTTPWKALLKVAKCYILEVVKL